MKEVKNIIWTDDKKEENSKIIHFPSLSYVMDNNAVDINNELLESIIDKVNITLPDGIVGITKLTVNENATGHEIYTCLDLGTQLADCFGDLLVCDCSTYFLDENNDFCFRGMTGPRLQCNYIKFRKWKDSISEFNKCRYIDEFREGVISEDEIIGYTEPIGSYIKEMLGE